MATTNKVITENDIGKGLQIKDKKLVAEAVVEDEKVYFVPTDGSIRILRKYSNLPDYVTTNYGELQSVDNVDGANIFTYKWLFEEERTTYNDSTGELYKP